MTLGREAQRLVQGRHGLDERIVDGAVADDRRVPRVQGDALQKATQLRLGRASIFKFRRHRSALRPQRFQIARRGPQIGLEAQEPLLHLGEDAVASLQLRVEVRDPRRLPHVVPDRPDLDLS